MLPSSVNGSIREVHNNFSVARIWLLELSQKVPPHAIIDGFDISDHQFVPSKWLPKNVSFRSYDIKKPPSPEYQNKYDIVHISYLCFGFHVDEVPSVIANLKSMLKPGGYLIWVERDYYSQNPKLDLVSDEDLAWTKIREFARQNNPTVGMWVPRIPDFFRSGGLTEVDIISKGPSPENVFVWNNLCLGAWDDWSSSIVDEGMRRRFLRWLGQAYDENLQGFEQIWKLQVVIGRK